MMRRGDRGRSRVALAAGGGACARSGRVAQEGRHFAVHLFGHLFGHATCGHARSLNAALAGAGRGLGGAGHRPKAHLAGPPALKPLAPPSSPGPPLAPPRRVP